jgi:hypothetical protein
MINESTKKSSKRSYMYNVKPYKDMLWKPLWNHHKGLLSQTNGKPVEMYMPMDKPQSVCRFTLDKIFSLKRKTVYSQNSDMIEVWETMNQAKCNILIKGVLNGQMSEHSLIDMASVMIAVYLIQ